MKDDKSKLTPYVIYSVSLLIIATVVGLWVYFSGTRPSAQNPFGLLGDAFSLAGVFGLIGVLFLYIANEGYFDIISYGVKRVFRASFDANYKKSMKQTYIEYKAARKAKRKPVPMAMLIVSGIYLVIGVIFIILFYVVPLSL